MDILKSVFDFLCFFLLQLCALFGVIHSFLSRSKYKKFDNISRTLTIIFFILTGFVTLVRCLIFTVKI